MPSAAVLGPTPGASRAHAIYAAVDSRGQLHGVLAPEGVDV